MRKDGLVELDGEGKRKNLLQRRGRSVTEKTKNVVMTANH